MFISLTKWNYTENENWCRTREWARAWTTLIRSRHILKLAQICCAGGDSMIELATAFEQGKYANRRCSYTCHAYDTNTEHIFATIFYALVRSFVRSISLQARFGPKCSERRRWRRSSKRNKSLNMNRHFLVYSKSDRLLCAKGRLQLSDTHLRNA